MFNTHTSWFILICVYEPKNQHIVYPYHMTPIPWNFYSLHIPHSPCTFPSTHIESHAMSLDIDTNHFCDFFDGVQHKILSMVAFLSLLDKLYWAYHALKSSFWVSITIYHEPCWGTCLIYDIRDEEFL